MLGTENLRQRLHYLMGTTVCFSFALLYTELEDHSQAFINFMDAISSNEINGLDCEDVFWKCSTDDDYVM